MKLRTVALFWFVVLLLFFVFSTPLAEWIWMLYIVPHYGLVLIGVGLVVASVVQSVRKKAVQVVPLVASLLGLVLFFSVGFRGGRLALFALRESRYEKLQAEATRTGLVDGDAGVIEEGPPVRYAFYWQRGLLDNWVGVVHDPSGELMKSC